MTNCTHKQRKPSSVNIDLYEYWQCRLNTVKFIQFYCAGGGTMWHIYIYVMPVCGAERFVSELSCGQRGFARVKANENVNRNFLKPLLHPDLLLCCPSLFSPCTKHPYFHQIARFTASIGFQSGYLFIFVTPQLCLLKWDCEPCHHVLQLQYDGVTPNWMKWKWWVRVLVEDKLSPNGMCSGQMSIWVF